jgi:O-antigen ligase
MSVVHSADVLVQRDFKASGRAHSSAFLPARVALLAALIAAPWAFGAVDAWAWTSLGLAACLTLLLWVAGAVRQKMLRLMWSPLYIPLAAFFLLALAQYLVGHTLDKTETREALVLFAVDSAFFFAAVQLLGETSSHARRWFGLAVLLFAGVLGLFAILQLGSGAPRIYWTFDTSGTFFGPYSNPDHYAGFMEMLVPVGVCYIASQRQKYSVAVLLLLSSAATVAVASLLLTGSRGGLLALSTEIAIAGVMFRSKAQSANKWGLTASLVGALLAVVLLFSWIDPGRAAQRLGVIVDQGQTWIEATDFRRRVALDSLHMLRDHPAFGVGLGNFEIAYPPYQSFPSDLAIDFAHNDYVQAAAETGLVGAALIVSALALFFRLAFHNVSQRLESGHGWIQLGATLGCCGLLVHSFVDFNLHIPANAAWFAVLAGVASTGKPSTLDGVLTKSH